MGTQYRSAIFYHNDDQAKIAQASKAEEEVRLGKSIATEIKEAGPFYAAEGYHQKYLQIRTGQSAFKGDKSNIRCYG